jgi:hypothetical protein
VSGAGIPCQTTSSDEYHIREASGPTNSSTIQNDLCHLFQPGAASAVTNLEDQEKCSFIPVSSGEAFTLISSLAIPPTMLSPVAPGYP